MFGSSKSIINRSLTSLYRSNRNLASISFEKFGTPANVCKVQSDNGISNGNVAVKIEVAEVMMEDLRHIYGLNLVRTSTGVAGETGVGKVKSLNQPVGGLSVNDNVLVVGNGTWKTDGNFSDTNVFKIPNLSSQQAAHLPSALIAYGLLTKYCKLNQGDIVVQSNKITPVSSAVSQIGKHLGYNVVLSSAAELENKEYLTKLKAQGKVKLGISANDSKFLKGVYKAVGLKGAIVLYNNQLEDNDGLHLSVAKAVFEDVSIYGLNLSSWANSDKSEFQSAVNTVAKLITDKVISIPNSQVFPHTDFVKAFSVVNEGKAAVLTF